MRSFGIWFVLAGLILSSAGSADAQKSSNKDMNERINALRNRLQNYQLERVRKEPQKVALINENETVEVKFEQLVEEFESRKDVAVTVLFHDADYSENAVNPGFSAALEQGDKNVEKAQTPADSVKAKTGKSPSVARAKPSSLPTLIVADAAHQLEQERAQRQEKYAELRRKVQLATRGVHENAQQINGMVAQIP